MALEWIILAILLAAVSGIPALFCGRSSPRGQRWSAGLMTIAGLAGLLGAGLGLSGDRSVLERCFPWPAVGDSVVGVDALSAFFLVPVFLMGGLGAIYGMGYWPQKKHPGNGRKLCFFWGLLVAGMALLLVSRHALAFLLGWEIMALSAFFLVATEDHRGESRRAGWVYLVATHAGTLSLFALLALWREATGAYALQPAGALSLGAMNGLFFLALFGFGLKAGLMPLHFWLPGAHATAPSHVSAMLSGVVLKMGIYGLVRWLSLLPAPPGAWGGILFALGAVSGLLGVVFAIGQHDLKRLLAYHSVENIGIIFMGLGLALIGRSAGRPEWVIWGLAGGLLHVWNHSLFKALLFLCAGVVVHATHTRQMDRLGGLARRMPWSAAFFLIGAVAICGLPPLNGFVSEWLIYMGLLRTASGGDAVGSAAVIGVPALAMIGALALACFVKVYGAVFLGNPRSPSSTQAHEAPRSMRAPMWVLALSCVAIGLAPVWVVTPLARALTVAMPGLDTASASIFLTGSLRVVGVVSLLLAGSVLTLAALFLKRMPVWARAGTWDCGYARPTPRMQYTAASFARSIVHLWHWALRPHSHPPHIRGFFPAPTEWRLHVSDPVLDRLLLPYSRRIMQWSGWAHRFQQGLTQRYVLYILIALIVMLSTLVPLRDLFARWFAR